MSKRILSRKHSKQRFAVTVFLLAFTAFICGVLLVQVARQHNEPELITHSTDKPNESKQEAERYNWKGTPLDPKKIVIESLGVDTYIQRMGVDQNDEIAVPTNVHLAGWFTESSQPGKKGLAIISGHVSGITSAGVFEKLGNLQPKDKFQIIRGNDSKLEYEVFTTETLRENDSVSKIFSQEPSIKSQVNLVTCTGTFNDKTSRYDKRVVVSARLAE